jgi:CRP/FNR family transcriptional regulator
MSPAAPLPVPPAHGIVSIRALRAHCGTCSMRELCLPVGLKEGEVEQLVAIVGRRTTRVAKGQSLFRHGAPFSSLFAVRLGSFKTTVLAEDGREQIEGYHLPGDILGLDGMHAERHGCTAVALEDSEACLIPFDRLEEVAREVPALQHNLYRIVGREIHGDHRQLLLLGSMRAEERLAAFLIDLSDRYHARGYSSTEFVLRMTREEIGSFLGLKLETVSRLFSRFQQEGLVQVQGRTVRIVDLPTLRRLVGSV